MLDGLFVTPQVTAISEALASANATGDVIVVGHKKLAAALASARTVLSTPPADAAPGSVAAVIAVLGKTDDHATVRSWTRAVRDGGVLVLVDRGHAAAASRLALCAGLTEIEQRHAGRTVVTSGLVTHLT